MVRWWLVLDRLGDRVVHQTPSWTEAYRLARRRSGGRVSLRKGPEYGVTVIGSLSSCTVVAIVGEERSSTRRPASVAASRLSYPRTLAS